MAQSPGNDDLDATYGKFRDEARCLDPKNHPKTVNTTGWAATQVAWRALFPKWR